TRITTKYHVPHPSPPPHPYKPTSAKPSKDRPSKRSQASANLESAKPQQSVSTHQAPKAKLTLKTYDPVSGTCLKYTTDKAAEVGRLVVALGRCGRAMAGMSVDGEENDASRGEAMEVDGLAKPEGDEKEEVKVSPKEEGKDGRVQGKNDGGGAGKKKKKGKR
ncbi:MAG: hypothetical protein Q9163_004226, partial [Psora crenata]